MSLDNQPGSLAHEARQRTGVEDITIGKAIGLIPARDWLLVDMQEKKYEGSLIIPDTAKDAPQHGVVIAVGPGHFVLATHPSEASFFDPLVTKVGDRILFMKYAGADVEWEGKTYLLVKESDIASYIK